ncbi:MAG: bifunctional 5,10-methylene-tetrahydrofolate dehydrogenase/5,10-methylene-tetrahydrofolate cyclohydrolase, partial [Verrucomicrobiota bacterium]|nr:bifunctional 5,10-methylene-tetrahydrofolate dehydrogenase/5,10-methylene-tetrahydrofolate cyclohydrolase [Verrucomicrobiota bacterium]
MSHLLEGRTIAEKVYAELRGEIAELKKSGRTPGLAVVLVGDNPASRAYVRSKDKMCRDLGLHSAKLELPTDTTQEDLLARVQDLNRDTAIHGILVQSPPPRHIDEAAITRALDPGKDVDGFHPVNVAKLALGDDSGFVPCTPLGCQRLLIESGTEIAGAHVVVLGRSMIVGKPLALLLMRKGKG